MTSVISINNIIPGNEYALEYNSTSSLKDYDIVLFNPQFPYYGRLTMSGGGSIIDIEGARQLTASIRHWKSELTEALKDGKTVFFILNTYTTDEAARSSTSKGNTRTYSSDTVNNYSVLPSTLTVRNSAGSKIKVSDSRFHDLFKGVEPYMSYKVQLSAPAKNPIFTTKDGTGVLGKISRTDDYPGQIVYLPNFELENLTETDKNGDEIWSTEALGAGSVILKQLREIDKVLRKESSLTPPPSWVDDVPRPESLTAIEQKIAEAQVKIDKALQIKENLGKLRQEMESTQHLLYETGGALEDSIEAVLHMLGYSVSKFRAGDLEIDHVVISPEGKRFVGEAEGKDTSAVGISKFRQLESNIGEDFERDEVDEAASGILFGNGFRLSAPEDRGEQFTEKCVKNAIRLGTILVRTMDLYPIAIHLQDHPDDELFKSECRTALESAQGGIAIFPPTPHD